MHQTTRRIALFFCFTLSLAVLSNIAQAQTYTVLYTFSGSCGGGFAIGGVTLDQEGRIYGTTVYGGAHDGGVVYRLAREGEGWVCLPLYSFGYQDQDGSNPFAGVVFGPDGLLYGTTSDYGAYGYGTVFSLQPPASACKSFLCPWLETILYNFTGGADGGYPGYGKLVFDQAGNIYGTTDLGGSQGEGVVFKLSRSGSGWTESAIWSFINGSGGTPLSGVIFDSAGNLYGTTPSTVYELSPTQSGWSETTLSTNVGGAGGLTWDAHGDLFGMTGNGNQGGDASVYELTPQNGGWTSSVLYDFGELYFAPAAAPTFDSQGNLYGPLPTYPQQGFGEIFKLTPSGDQWIYSPYHQFTGGSGGAGPVGAVVFDANGNMYGTTAGVDFGGGSAVWEITP
jgi:uncharacterized repeat protein (TIGR03803 family)